MSTEQTRSEALELDIPVYLAEALPVQRAPEAFSPEQLARRVREVLDG